MSPSKSPETVLKVFTGLVLVALSNNKIGAVGSCPVKETTQYPTTSAAARALTVSAGALAPRTIYAARRPPTVALPVTERRAVQPVGHVHVSPLLATNATSRSPSTVPVGCTKEKLPVVLLANALTALNATAIRR